MLSGPPIPKETNGHQDSAEHDERKPEFRDTVVIVTLAESSVDPIHSMAADLGGYYGSNGDRDVVETAGKLCLPIPSYPQSRVCGKHKGVDGERNHSFQRYNPDDGAMYH